MCSICWDEIIFVFTCKFASLLFLFILFAVVLWFDHMDQLCGIKWVISQLFMLFSLVNKNHSYLHNNNSWVDPEGLLCWFACFLVDVWVVNVHRVFDAFRFSGTGICYCSRDSPKLSVYCYSFYSFNSLLFLFYQKPIVHVEENIANDECDGCMMLI